MMDPQCEPTPDADSDQDSPLPASSNAADPDPTDLAASSVTSDNPSRRPRRAATTSPYRRGRRLRKWTARFFVIGLLLGNMYFLVIAPEKGWLLINPFGTPVKPIRTEQMTLSRDVDVMIERMNLPPELSAAVDLIAGTGFSFLRIRTSSRVSNAEIRLEKWIDGALVHSSPLYVHQHWRCEEAFLALHSERDRDEPTKWKCRFTLNLGGGMKLQGTPPMDIPEVGTTYSPIVTQFAGAPTLQKLSETGELELWKAEWGDPKLTLRLVAQFWVKNEEK